MAVAPVILKTNPHRPVDFKESAVLKVLAASGNLNLEVKEDGCQLNMVVEYDKDGAHVFFLSREGKMFNGLVDLGAKLSADDRWHKFFNPHLDAGLFRDRGGFMLQAEILIDGKVCAEIAGDMRRMSPIDVSKIEIVAFDLIPYDIVEAGCDYEVYQELRMMHTGIQVDALKSRFPEIKWRCVDMVPVYSLAQLMEAYEVFRHDKKEGGVAKDPLSYWKRGKKTGQWKIKPDDECDGVITGLMWGTPGLANEGRVIGFTVLTEHGVEVEAGGLTEAQKDEFTEKVRIHTLENCYAFTPDPSLTVESLVKNLPEGFNWNPYDQNAVKITYMERLPSGSYRHPNFDSFRGITDPLTKE